MHSGKVMLLLGARRIGKTSFIQQWLKNINESVLVLNGEDLGTAASLSERTVENYKRIVGKHNIVVIDEAQKIPDIGQILKLMIDELPNIKIVATGSSVFDLSNRLGEPLTGRSITFYMYPLAQMELAKEETAVQTRTRLEERLIYGSYPELWQYSGNDEKAKYLKDIVNNYLFKDILIYDGVRNSAKMVELLRLIAFQIGKEVSIHEIAQQMGISRATVEKYLDLLTKVFILFKISAFSRNLRSEIAKSSKWFFYDNGIRNALISNFQPLKLRNDKGDLWENYIISERIKYQHYSGLITNNYFWRTYQQQEIDWVEEREGKLFAYEIKWKADKKNHIPSAWKDTYKNSKFEIIHTENYLDWIGG
jgi:predicted AAA+ superfamily ATPase